MNTLSTDSVNSKSAANSRVYTYIVGDIHGCYKELLALEQLIVQDAASHDARPFIVSVGDMIDRGPASVPVVEHFYHGVQAGTHAVVAGNHEQQYMQCVLAELPQEFVARGLTFPEYVRRELNPYAAQPLKVDLEKSRTIREAWFTHGGSTPISELGGGPEPDEHWFFRPDLMQFLCEPKLIWFDERVLVSHALIDAAHARQLTEGHGGRLSDLGNNEYHQILRSSMWERELPEIPPGAQRTHVSGHTTLHAVQRLTDLNLLRIDTSCVYGYELSAWCVDTDEVLSVKSGMPCLD